MPSIPIAKPWLDTEEAEAAARAILSGWITQGPEVAAFEREFAAYVGAEHACAVSNCTVALHLALLAVGVRPGDEVITVSHSFVATASSIRYCGATPVFVDIQPETFNIDPALIERVITNRTRAILCVHQMGMPCDLEAIVEVAQRHSLPVVEDAACAIGSEICWQGTWEKIGKPHGDIACFSFHPRKIITTGDGGMITTSNHEWDKQLRLWRQHGMSATDTTRHNASEVIFESYSTLGYNYRLTDIQAAVGREQLRRLPEIIERRRFLAERYGRLLERVRDEIAPPVEPSWARSNWQSYCVRLAGRHQQRDVMQAMLDAGIATRRGVMCTHREPAYVWGTWTCGASVGCICENGACARLSRSEQAQDRALILPLFHEMTDTMQVLVVKCLEECVREEARVMAH